MENENDIGINKALRDVLLTSGKIIAVPSEMSRAGEHYLALCKVLNVYAEGNGQSACGSTSDIVDHTVFYSEAQLSKQSTETIQVIASRLGEMEFPKEQVDQVVILLTFIFTCRLRGLTDTFRIYMHRRGKNENILHSITFQPTHVEKHYYMVIESKKHNPKPSPWESIVFPFNFRSSTVSLTSLL